MDEVSVAETESRRAGREIGRLRGMIASGTDYILAEFKAGRINRDIMKGAIRGVEDTYMPTIREEIEVLFHRERD